MREMTLLIVKHVDTEGPGIIEVYLRKGRIPYQILNLESDECFPKLDDLTHIVLLGGPMNVYEEDRYPFLIRKIFLSKGLSREGSEF